MDGQRPLADSRRQKVQYMIMNFVQPADPAEVGRPEADPDWPAWEAYTKALIDAGVMRGGNGLKPAFTGTTVRVRDGRREVQDGPYADTKEHLGGYYVIDVPDLDTALEWAAKNPAASSGAVEVRPILTL
jgi:hypothetical protein